MAIRFDSFTQMAPYLRCDLIVLPTKLQYFSIFFLYVCVLRMQYMQHISKPKGGKKEGAKHIKTHVFVMIILICESASDWLQIHAERERERKSYRSHASILLILSSTISLPFVCIPIE